MAHSNQLPCDSDGICMKCKKETEPQDILTCKTCNTPWHINCLSSPPQSLSLVLEWDCPDCNGDGVEESTAALPPVESTSLIASIRAIEADESLTEQEKAKKRQALLSGGVGGGSKDKEEENGGGGDNMLDLFDGRLNCSFCMQLPDRPVTTPCGHNFCLKCFQKWVGQGKRTCAKCRSSIPPKMASQPRINSSLVVAIRMAKMSKPSTTTGPLKVYHFVDNQNRPDKAFTTERAKKAGKANACSGKIFVTVPSDYFGPILAENDPERNQGVLVGECWEDRMECRQWGAHLPHVAGIAGQSDYGAQSVALSGGYEDDEDHGEWFLYTGSGGRDLSGNKRTNKDQSFDQKFEKSNEALRVSCKKGYPVRVVRSHKEKRSSFAPETGVRYDGIYRIEKCWRKVGIQGFKVCRYLFVRCDNEPAPWTSDEHGDKPRPLPVIKELKNATDITERKEKPSWDFDEVEGCWKWKRPPPKSKMPIRIYNGGDPEERKIARKAKEQHHNAFLREKLLKEFCCLICRKVMTSPLTTPCAHNFCKHCLEGAFAGQTFERERTCKGGRTLRTQKNIMKCPSCPMDISDFLQNPQVNRDLMDVIESLQRKIEENVEEAGDKIEDSIKESNGIEEKSESGGGETEVGAKSLETSEDNKESNDIEEKSDSGSGETETGAKSLEMSEDDNTTLQTSPTKGKPKKKDIEGDREKCPVQKCDTVKRNKSDASLKHVEKPESEKEQLLAPKARSRPKRKKPENDNCELQTPTTESRSRRKKAENGNCELQAPASDSSPKRKKADSDNCDMQTPTGSGRKRNKTENDNCGSTPSGVRTRSMKSKELLDEGNSFQLDTTKAKHPNKRKKPNADSGLKLEGVRTRSRKS